MSGAKTPIESILGVPPNAGPFAVLGVDPSEISDAAVVEALSRRMVLLADHPLSETAEGNEVRLALHAAAAQLLDPAVRAALRRKLGERASASERARQQPIAPSSPAISPQLAQQALLVVGLHGGWNQRAMRRLVLLAHASGVGSDRLGEIVRQLIATPPAQRQATTPQRAVGRIAREPGPGPRATVSDRTVSAGPRRRSPASVLPVVVLGVLSVAALVSAWTALERSSSAQRREAEERLAAAQQAEASDTGRAPEAAVDPAATPNTDAPAAGGGLQPDQPNWVAAAISLRDDPEPPDAEVFSTVVAGLASTWLARPADDNAFVLRLARDLLFRLPTDERLAAISKLTSLAQSPDQVAASWSVGLLARLSAEPTLGSPSENAVLAGLAASIGPRVRSMNAEFAGGVGQWLLAMLETSGETSGGAGDAWAAVLAHLASIDPAQARAINRQALAILLRGERPAEPAMLQTLLAGLNLPDDRDGVGVVLDALSDRDVSARAASLLMREIRGLPASEGVRDEIDLAATASMSDRAAARRALADAWLSGNEPSWAGDEFARLSEAHLEQPPGRDAVALLADAVRSSRLVEAGLALHWGEQQRAERRLGSLGDGVVTEPPAAARSRVPSPAGARDWARRYLEAKRNIPIRRSLIGELVRQRPVLGTVAAEVLVSEATLGSPVQVRRDAQDAVAVFASEPAVVNAMLELLPRVPRVASTAGVVERVAQTRLPPVDRDDWPAEARRAIVRRLLGLVAGDQQGALIDELTRLLADSYSVRAGGSSGRTTDDSGDLLRFSEASRLAWTDQVRRSDRSGSAAAAVGRIDQLSRGRRLLAAGGIGAFAASQVTLFEFAAEGVRLERPESSRRIDDLLRSVADQRRSAPSAVHQIAAVERGMVALMRIRLGSVEP
ncbi:MAG: hypothetical protein AAGF47_00425 [Planctomycetota bacterium]